MFRLKALGVSILGAAMALAIHGPAKAQEILSEDGTVKFEDGIPQYSGGTELFTFQYHQIVDENDPENLLLSADRQLVSLDPVELFREYGDSTRVLEAPGMSALMAQSLEGGFASSFSDMVLTELAVLQKNCVVNGAPIQSATIKPVYSVLRLHTNPIRTNAVLNIFSYKLLECSEDGVDISIPLKRRWVISIGSGLEQGPIDKTIGGVQMTYKMFAQGKSIKLMAYYSNLTLHGERWGPNMRLISGFDQLGNVDPRNKYYTPKAASCLDIDFKNKPPNDVDVWSVAPSDMRFCARGCIPGDVSATK
ncbi:hypothetical protein [Ruegeria arenilitoris]|uniref:hypothetical protein n=1 Tax=Ruegeria arenilitoris TaxID=1173585 RepID=UPI00147E5EAE|nr:hypothetical protein [Ruegeria arenilitoris]